MLDFTTTLAFVSAMMTPAVLILACGAMLFTTSHRFGREADRIRDLVRQLDGLANLPDGNGHRQHRAERLQEQLLLAGRQSTLLQRSLTCLYVALLLFIATSGALGLVALRAEAVAPFPVPLAVSGAVFLFLAILFLMAESRLALKAAERETRVVLARRMGVWPDLESAPPP